MGVKPRDGEKTLVLWLDSCVLPFSHVSQDLRKEMTSKKKNTENLYLHRNFKK